jgi:alkylated DNA nucleotide flippase Atl1
MRSVLQHPRLLGKVPYLLETPRHLPQHRALRRRDRSIQALDDKLSHLERSALEELLAFSDQAWNDKDLRSTWWKDFEHRSRAIKKRIGKAIRLALRLGDDEEWRAAKVTSNFS